MTICKKCLHGVVCLASDDSTLVCNHFKDSSRYIELPCKVGDVVWYELYGDIQSAVVYSCVGVLKKQGFDITDANAKSVEGLEVAFNGKCLGKTVFLTKEEAEKALKERKGK